MHVQEIKKYCYHFKNRCRDSVGPCKYKKSTTCFWKANGFDIPFLWTDIEKLDKEEILRLAVLAEMGW